MTRARLPRILRPFQGIESLFERVNGLKAAAPASQSGDSILCSGLRWGASAPGEKRLSDQTVLTGSRAARGNRVNRQSPRQDLRHRQRDLAAAEPEQQGLHDPPDRMAHRIRSYYRNVRRIASVYQHKERADQHDGMEQDELQSFKYHDGHIRWLFRQTVDGFVLAILFGYTWKTATLFRKSS